jgi:hypothetical protein
MMMSLHIPKRHALSFRAKFCPPLAEDGTQSRNLQFDRRKSRLLDSALEMTMRNFHGEYVGARVPARAGVNEKWLG